uniref:Voltage-dependent calcium channel alpha-2/delta subunit conserved region domain-containing protein n=1 Tax=Poecilia reticulata TaxID=8081 RepID=A0A3P9Q2H2_POERE
HYVLNAFCDCNFYLLWAILFSLKNLLSFLFQTGNFFGEAEGAVMNKLLQMGSFKRVTLYDYQALCWVHSESSDSGHTLLDVSILQPLCVLPM